MSSIYVMTVGDLAKKRGQPVGDFVKAVQALGFEAGSHAKRLTQPDLDFIISKLDGTAEVVPTPAVSRQDQAVRNVTNPNVLMVKIDDRNTLVAFVEASLKEDGTIAVEVVSSSIENGIGETLLEYRKQVGSKMGVN